MCPQEQEVNSSGLLDNKDVAPRFGFSWDPFGKGNSVAWRLREFLRSSFDNLWQSIRANNVNVPFDEVQGTGATTIWRRLLQYFLRAVINRRYLLFPVHAGRSCTLRNGYSQLFLGISSRSATA